MKSGSSPSVSPTNRNRSSYVGDADVVLKKVFHPLLSISLMYSLMCR